MGLLTSQLNAVLMHSNRCLSSVSARTSGSRVLSLSSSRAEAAFFFSTMSFFPGSPDLNIWGGHAWHSLPKRQPQIAVAGEWHGTGPRVISALAGLQPLQLPTLFPCRNRQHATQQPELHPCFILGVQRCFFTQVLNYWSIYPNWSKEFQPFGCNHLHGLIFAVSPNCFTCNYTLIWHLSLLSSFSSTSILSGANANQLQNRRLKISIPGRRDTQRLWNIILHGQTYCIFFSCIKPMIILLRNQLFLKVRLHLQK